MDEPKDQRYYCPDGSLKWGHPGNVQHLILQLQTLDPEMAVSSVTFIDTEDGKQARAYGLTLSYERWDANGWLNFTLPGPKCLAVWATEPVKIEGINGPDSAAAPALGTRKELSKMKFRKKPVVIEAVQWDGENVADIRDHFREFPGWRISGCEYLIIQTLEGELKADPGDWIIKGVKGEFYPCKPDIFAATYDRVVE